MFENFLRLALILLWAYGWRACFCTRPRRAVMKSCAAKTAVIKRFLGFTETAIVLGSVAGLFLAFVIIQFQYFFGGQANLGVEGFTRSEYARRGFNEMVTVGFLSLLLTLD